MLRKRLLILGITTMVLITLIPSSASSAEYLVPNTRDISHLVQGNCGSFLHANNHIVDSTKSDYANCVFSTFQEHNLFKGLFESCDLDLLILIEIDKNPPPATLEGPIKCFVGLITQQGIATQLGALAEACELHISKNIYPGGCKVNDYCQACPLISIAELLDLSCNKVTRMCQDDLIQVKHIETDLIGECNGTKTVYNEFPTSAKDNELKFGRSSGIVEYFFWKVNTTLQPDTNLDFDFTCRGKASITGQGSGGFYRQVVFRSTIIEAGGIMCSYDGFTDTSCRGSIKSDNEAFGYPGRFHIGESNEEYFPPRTMIFEHDSGWVLHNLHQGSLRVYQGMDPEPAEIPPKILDVPIKYNIDDKRTEEEALPFISTGVVFFLVVNLLIILRRKAQRRKIHHNQPSVLNTN